LLAFASILFGQSSVTGAGITLNGAARFSESAISYSRLKQLCGSTGLSAVREDGSCFAAGYDSPGLTFPKDLPPLVQIATGYSVSAGLLADGSVRSWGDLTFGKSMPVGLNHVVKLISSGQHILALKDNGTVAAWGLNGNGECEVPAGLNNVVDIAVANSVSMALRADGTIAQFGFPYARLDHKANEPDPASNFTRIAGGGGMVVALRADGSGTRFRPADSFYYDGLNVESYGKIDNIRELYCDGAPILLMRDGSVRIPADDYPSTDLGWIQPGDEWTKLPSNVRGLATSTDFTSGPGDTWHRSKSVWALGRDGSLTTIRGGVTLLSGVEHLVDVVSNKAATKHGTFYFLNDAYGLRDDGSLVSFPSGELIPKLPKLRSFATSVFGNTYPELYYVGVGTDGKPVNLGDLDPHFPAGLSGVQALVIDSTSAVALLAGGKTSAWTLGSGTPIASPANLPAVKQVALSRGGIFGLVKTGEVRWLNTSTPPAGISALKGVTKIAGGDLGLVVLFADGKVSVFQPYGEATGLGAISGVTDIYAAHDTIATKDAQNRWTVLTGDDGRKSVVLGSRIAATSQGEVFANGGVDDYRWKTSYVGIPEMTVRVPSSEIAPGQTATGEVWLRSVASVGGTTVALRSSDPSVAVPSSVTVPSGKQTATFKISVAKAQTADTPISVEARWNLTTQRAQFLVCKPFRVDLDRSYVVGGSTEGFKVRVTLKEPAGSKGLKLTLAYDSAALKGPASITVPAGQTTATLDLASNEVQSPIDAGLTVTSGEVSDLQEVSVLPFAVRSLTVGNGDVVFGGDLVPVRLQLNAKMANARAVRIVSSNQRAVQDFDVMVAANTDVVEAPVLVSATCAEELVTLKSGSAAYPVKVVGFTISVDDAAVGSYGRGTISFANYLTSDRTITLTGDAKVGSVTSTVTIQKGFRDAAFDFRLKADASGTFKISGAAAGLSGYAEGKVALPTIADAYFTRTDVQGGSDQIVKIVISVKSPSDTGSMRVRLVNSKPGAINVPSSVTLKPGTSTVEVPVVHNKVSGSTWVSVQVALNGVVKTIYLTVH
jgi:hypothetical protein